MSWLMICAIVPFVFFSVLGLFGCFAVAVWSLMTLCGGIVFGRDEDDWILVFYGIVWCVLCGIGSGISAIFCYILGVWK